jgi:hypothetical protein
MPQALPRTHRHIRASVASLLLHKDRFGKLFCVSSIAKLLNAAIAENDSVNCFTKEIVGAAFHNGQDEHGLPLSSMGFDGHN